MKKGSYLNKGVPGESGKIVFSTHTRYPSPDLYLLVNVYKGQRTFYTSNDFYIIRANAVLFLLVFQMPVSPMCNTPWGFWYIADLKHSNE